MIIAVTLYDEINMIACEVAHSLFNVPLKIARIRAQQYLQSEYSDLFSREHLPIDVAISPEIEVGKMVLRRIAFIRVAQGMGLSLDEIAGALQGLPDGRTPDRHDWDRIAGQWQTLLDSRIAALQLMKRKLSACIGCGCLSLEHCALYNPGDSAAGQGGGPRYLLGDLSPVDE